MWVRLFLLVFIACFSEITEADDLYSDFKKYKKSQTKFKVINDKKDSDYSITDQFIKLLEKQIYRDPSQYFWSHNRFKYIID